MTMPPFFFRLDIVAMGLAAFFALAPLCPARASGDGSEDEFVQRAGTDMPLDAYANGHLGVVLPTYDRTYRYLAWRAIVLGPDKLKVHPIAPGGASKALGRFVDGWLPAADAKPAIQRWQAASAAALGLPAPAIKSVMVELRASSYLNCPDAAFESATAMLATLKARADATPMRIMDWVSMQHIVFQQCGRVMRSGSGGADTTAQATAFPGTLPETELPHWRQMRQYQIASAYFYAGDFNRSADLFKQIGQTKGHAMRQWGAYLALRSAVRTQSVDAGLNARADAWHPSEQTPAMRDIELAARAILQDASLAAVHEATRATLRSAQSRFAPLPRFQSLSADLANPAQDPTTEDRLGDWRMLANGSLDAGPANIPASVTELASQFEFLDWLITTTPCDEKPCQTQRLAHASDRWEHAPTGSHRRAWLMGLMMIANQLDGPLEKEARAVPRAAPEYSTIRYNLLRMLSAAGRVDEARTIANEMLQDVAARPGRSINAENLLRRQRFALATSLQDAARFAPRQLKSRLDPDTHERTFPESDDEPEWRLEEDGMAWLNRGLSTSDLLRLAQNQAVPDQLRLQSAIAAWLRAGALGDEGQALLAARYIDKRLPTWQPHMRAYMAAKTPLARRHALILAALRLDLSADFRMYVATDKERQKMGSQVEQHPDTTAGMWCGFNPQSGQTARTLPIALDVSSNPEARDAEMARLATLKTATGFVGEHVMQWAASNPQDPDLPWLLHVVVMSTRGGCLDKDAAQLSRAAHALLHKRYRNSEWAAKTPYFYGRP